MTKTPLRRWTLPTLLFLILTVVSAGFSFAENVSAGPAGKIADLSGVVYFKGKDVLAWSLAAKGQGLNDGDAVKTGSDGRAQLLFSDGTKLMLGNETEIEITKFLTKGRNRAAVLTLSTGKVRAVVKKFSGKSDVQVKTPTAVAGVRGTDFIVMNQGSANVMFGESGKVEASGDGGGKAVPLTAGTMTENTQGVAPIAPVKVEPGTPLEAARKQLEAVTDVSAPVEWEEAGKLPLILARWNINYGNYLAESKRYKEALEVFQIAIDLTETPDVRADAHFSRGTVFSLYLNEPAKALAEYEAVIEKYPSLPAVENAIYFSAKLNVELGFKEAAKKLFRAYLERFPQGRHKDSAETLLKTLE
ncbi:MAG: FecR domain-containing protein [Deltaproteobacteria bacterium]|nr:FecR domain-containing protein [Deltaproteobacteria bacterium]